MSGTLAAGHQAFQFISDRRSYCDDREVGDGNDMQLNGSGVSSLCVLRQLTRTAVSQPMFANHIRSDVLPQSFQFPDKSSAFQYSRASNRATVPVQTKKTVSSVAGSGVQSVYYF